MFKKIKKATRLIITFILAIIVVVGAFIQFNAHYTTGGIIVEVKEDTIVIKELAYGGTGNLPLEEKSRFYDINGKEIPLSGLKIGDHVKVRLFPRMDWIFFKRPRNTVRWIRVLPN